MSASEKLKALEPAQHRYLSSNFFDAPEIEDAFFKLTNALPQIVAVVEALEAYAHPGSWTPLRDGQGVTFTGPNRLDSHPREIAERALTALEETLK